jgi:hypothetical protein
MVNSPIDPLYYRGYYALNPLKDNAVSVAIEIK